MLACVSLPQVWDLTANKCMEVMTDGQNHPIQSLSMATNASVLVGANNKGMVYVFSPGNDTKVMMFVVGRLYAGLDYDY